ncbi:MAG: Tfp pilus assembly protein PilF [Verrucomicrobiales bacterium]
MAGEYGYEKLARARLLRAQGRHEEAEAFLIEAIASNPTDPDAFCELALCQLCIPEKKKSSLDSIDRALALEPTAEFFAVKAMVLNALDREQQALTFADKAIALDPDESFHFYVKAAALAGLSRWAAAEAECRMALTLDADDKAAKNLLAIVLRMQGKKWETEVAVDQLLSENPEDAWAHSNAGWAALTNSDYKKAEKHFRESLRLDPGDEQSRSGLLEAFKARSPLYRAYLKYVFWMARFQQKTRWLIIIGIYIGFRIGRVILEKVHPLLAVVFVFVYLILVFGGLLASGVGNLLILMDRSARYALNKREVIEALFVGGGFFGGILMVIAGFGFGLLPLVFVGGAITIGAIPLSLTFTNDSANGQKLFGAIGAFVYVVGFWAAGQWMMSGAISEATSTLIGFAALAAVLCTWIGNVESLRR